MFRIKAAEDLQPGDRIITNQRGRVETVDAATTRDQYGGCSIHTEQHDILTGLPCDVKVLD